MIVVPVPRELDDENRTQFERHVLALADADPTIALDLSATRALGPRELRLLVSLDRALAEKGGSLRLRSFGRDIEDLFRASRLDTVLFLEAPPYDDAGEPRGRHLRLED
jgi:anti-anti-sigma factor